MAPRSTPVLLMAASLVAACGRSNLVDFEQYGDGDVVSDAGAQLDAAPIHDASHERDALPDAAPPPIGNYGYVILRSYEGTRMPVGAEATAVFYEGFPLACALGITGGTCAVASCPSSDTGVGFSAGDITFNDKTAMDGGAIHPTQVPPNGVHYDTWSSVPPIFQPGDAISVTASGATLPAFDTSMTFPATVSGFDPPFGASMLIGIDSTTPLHLTWDATSAPEILFYMTEQNGSSTTSLLICYFGSKAREGIVPSASLQAFKATLSDGGASVIGAVFPVARTIVTPAGWRVAINALGGGMGSAISLR